MARYQVYLEIDDDGTCLAHVPALPGCMLRAPSRQLALERLPQAIRDHLAWLRAHGEPVAGGVEPVEVEIAGEEEGGGPFDPGDAAALLPEDRAPVSEGEMAGFFRLMGYARQDLLALTQDLSSDLLDWLPTPESFGLRRMLRHVGNTEEWYVSRLVPPETLPAEWDADEGLSLFEFLEMERRTAVERLRRLTVAERSATRYPTEWTRHPEEAWTARKALRRFVEHEREHTVQAREILTARRQWHVARLASERAGLLEAAARLDEAMLSGPAVVGPLTVKDILAHVAAWDRWQHASMAAMVAGEAPDFRAVMDVDAANASFHAAWRDRPLDEVLDELEAARGDWLLWLASLSIEEFFRPRSYEGYDWSFDSSAIPVQARHDADHAGHIASWRRSAAPGRSVGPGRLLRAALVAARDELLAWAALVPTDQRARRLVCGAWTLKDLLGHVADWEAFGAVGLSQMAGGGAPQVEFVADIDGWNREHVEARRDESWEEVWADLVAARSAFLEALDATGPEALARQHSFPWGGQGTAYQWAAVYVAHDREHAADVADGLTAAGG